MGLALLFTPWTIHVLQKWGFLPQVPPHHLHSVDILFLLPALVDLFLVVHGTLIVFGARSLRHYLRNSLGYNLYLFLNLLTVMLSLNVIHPGKLLVLRGIYLVILLFILANSFYLGIVKTREGKEMPPFFRNISLSVFSGMMVLIVLEGLFMFSKTTHRFNGTLGSRAWFLNYWTLNENGYRDIDHDSAAVAGKRKVLVIGDSFVAGHGIQDPKDRFSDLLGAKLPPKIYEVFNLGVCGQDTRDEWENLKGFRYKPDVLVFSWYPNDIEMDGERGGLVLQHSISYDDLWASARYLVRRSYLWNYIYWRFPHPNELKNYFGYIQQCFAYPKVRSQHLREVDRLIAYGDSLRIPMVAVVFPFLENAAGSAFATDVIEARFREQGVPVLSVRSMIQGQPAERFVVNQNDPHPNERLHAMVADSLFELLNCRGAISQ
jgi:hypothetical protein